MPETKPPFYSRPVPLYAVLLVAFFALLPLVIHGLIEAEKSNNNNVRQWLPADRPEAKLYRYFREHFGSDEFALVTWEGCTLEDPRLRQFANAVRTHSTKNDRRLFEEVLTANDLLDRLTGPPFDLSQSEAASRITGIALGPDGRTASVIVKLTEHGDANRLGTVEVMGKLAVETVGLPEDKIYMIGDAVTNAAVDEESKNAIGNLFWLCIIVGFVAALVSLRSLRLMFTVFLAAAYCAALAEANVYFLGGSLNLVLVVMPVLVFVLSLSAGVHLVNYYRDAVEERGLMGAPERGIRHGWLPITLAAATTAIGLASLCVSEIIPVRDFGLYSALGILATLILLFLFLPALLVATDRLLILQQGAAKYRAAQVRSGKRRALVWVRSFGSFVTRHHVVTSVVCMLILVALTCGVPSIKTSMKPARFFNKDHPINTDYFWIADHIGPQIPMELIVKFDNKKSPLNTLQRLQLVSAIEQDLRGMKRIGKSDQGGTISAATWAPKLDPPEQDAGTTLLGGERTWRFVLNKRLEDHRYKFMEAGYLSEDKQKNQELWRISARMMRSREGEGEYDVFINDVRDRVTTFLTGRREQYEAAIAELDETVVDKREKLDAAYAQKKKEYAEDEDALAKLKTKYDEGLEQIADWQRARWATLVDDTPGVSVEYTGMVPLFFVAQRELWDGLKRSFLLAFGFIGLLMIVLLRSIRAGLVSMLPNVFPAAVVFGSMGWTGTIVDIGSMMTASVAMGIAVDDTVHFLTWFRRGMHQGMSRVEAVLHAYAKCALAMTQTTAIAGLGLVVFALSHFQPVAQFGFLMFVLLVAALVGDLIFLPALLAGPVGRLFEEKHLAAKAAAAERQTVSAPSTLFVWRRWRAIFFRS